MNLHFCTRDYLEKKLKRLGVSLTPLIMLAFEQAEKSHAHQKRDDGSSYLEQHIYPVTDNLIDFCIAERKKITEELVIGSLLHDALEDDSSLSHHKFKKNFGLKIFKIVHPLTKTFSGKMSKQKRRAYNQLYFAKLEASPWETKVIKLADRFNNISSIHVTPKKDKLARYIEETIEFYLPFAERVSAYFYVKIRDKLAELEALLNH